MDSPEVLSKGGFIVPYYPCRRQSRPTYVNVYKDLFLTPDWDGVVGPEGTPLPVVTTRHQKHSSVLVNLDTKMAF